MRTTGGAFAASIATTLWDSNATRARSNLSGLLNGPQEFIAGLADRGMTQDQGLNQLDALVQGQSVMLATDQIFMATAVLFVLAAGLIWLAPPVRRAVGTQAPH